MQRHWSVVELPLLSAPCYMHVLVLFLQLQGEFGTFVGQEQPLQPM